MQDCKYTTMDYRQPVTQIVGLGGHIRNAGRSILFSPSSPDLSWPSLSPSCNLMDARDRLLQSLDRHRDRLINLSKLLTLPEDKVSMKLNYLLEQHAFN